MGFEVLLSPRPTELHFLPSWSLMPTISNINILIHFLSIPSVIAWGY